jgi:hypothetical protein
MGRVAFVGQPANGLSHRQCVTACRGCRSGVVGAAMSQDSWRMAGSGLVCHPSGERGHSCLGQRAEEHIGDAILCPVGSSIFAIRPNGGMALVEFFVGSVFTGLAEQVGGRDAAVRPVGMHVVAVWSGTTERLSPESALLHRGADSRIDDHLVSTQPGTGRKHSPYRWIFTSLGSRRMGALVLSLQSALAAEFDRYISEVGDRCLPFDFLAARNSAHWLLRNLLVETPELGTAIAFRFWVFRGDTVSGAWIL